MLGPIFLFGGYCLVYAAVARGGRFATDPWNGVFADAYEDTGTTVSSPPAATGAGASGTQAFTRPRQAVTSVEQSVGSAISTVSGAL